MDRKTLMSPLSGPPGTTLAVAKFFAGFSGALGTLFLLSSFGTDYWSLAAESCEAGDQMIFPPWADAAEGRMEPGSALFYHEGLFWRCFFEGQAHKDFQKKFWITDQLSSKTCTHAYLFPKPLMAAHTVTDHDSAVVYREFWIAFIMLGIGAVVIGAFLGVGASACHCRALYKSGGVFFLMGGSIWLCVLVLYVVWFHATDTLEQHVLQQGAQICHSFHLSFCYGPSFMLAPVGIFFCLLAGLLFVLIARSMPDQRSGGNNGTAKDEKTSSQFYTSQTIEEVETEYV
ncbi:transmembrane protein 182 isoform X2 [Denticeps clupeoides]|uniref:Transmembrane protein 182 n=1 Tax=Denticeps clupeoides TaxID=299321 RepID=A0AAY4E6Q3_9TELE|nr:transmembrane protein 182-like isoform X2 [Denticeps clupeoides]